MTFLIESIDAEASLAARHGLVSSQRGPESLRVRRCRSELRGAPARGTHVARASPRATPREALARTATHAGGPRQRDRTDAGWIDVVW